MWTIPVRVITLILMNSASKPPASTSVASTLETSVLKAPASAKILLKITVCVEFPFLVFSLLPLCVEHIDHLCSKKRCLYVCLGRCDRLLVPQECNQLFVDACE